MLLPPNISSQWWKNFFPSALELSGACSWELPETGQTNLLQLHQYKNKVNIYITSITPVFLDLQTAPFPIEKHHGKAKFILSYKEGGGESSLTTGWRTSISLPHPKVNMESWSKIDDANVPWTSLIQCHFLSF